MQIEIAFEPTKAPRPRPQDGAYGFGKYFTDHMFMADYRSGQGWSRPRVVPYQPLHLDPGSAVLHYGQALFEGMKAYRGDDGRVRLFRPEANWQRMRNGADRLCMKFIDNTLFQSALHRLVRCDWDWIPKQPGTALYLRPTLIGSEAFLGLRPAEAFLFFVIASPVGGYYGDSPEPVKIWVERDYTRAAPGGTGAVKAGGNYAAALIASVEAKKRGFAQVLWLDAVHKRFVEEVGAMNVFFVIGDKLITPALNGTILPGITRDSVIQLARLMGVTVEERPVELAEVIDAYHEGRLKEVFGSGTAAAVSPVGVLGVDDEILVINHGRMGELATELQRQLLGIQYGRLVDPFGWTVEVTQNEPQPVLDSFTL